MPRRPLASLPPISCNDACHKARGSLGGTDYAVVVGTQVFAMFAGTARFRVAGTGGYTISIIRDGHPEQIGELMHLSRANGFTLGGSSHHVAEGDLVAWSGGAVGAPGSGSATGPHLHAHVTVGGIRYGMEEYLAKFALAGGGTPIEEEEEMNDTINLVDTSTYKSSAPVVGTKCATRLTDGTVWLYERTLKPNELAAQLAAKAGPHIECTHEQFVEWTTAPAAPPAGTVTLGTLKIETTGTIEPA